MKCNSTLYFIILGREWDKLFSCVCEANIKMPFFLLILVFEAALADCPLSLVVDLTLSHYVYFWTVGVFSLARVPETRARTHMEDSAWNHLCVKWGYPLDFSEGAVTKNTMTLRLSWNALSIVLIRLGKRRHSCLLEEKNNKCKVCSVYEMIQKVLTLR